LYMGFAIGPCFIWACCWLRVSELTGLLLGGVTLQPTPTVCVMGKGRKQRFLPLWKQTAADIRAWLAVRDQSCAPELFLNACGKPMTRVGFTYLLRKHARTAARFCPSLLEKQVSPHCFVAPARVSVKVTDAAGFRPGTRRSSKDSIRRPWNGRQRFVSPSRPKAGAQESGYAGLMAR
jgi:hypothetical protein